jgi:hypothetical protein
MSEWEYEEGDTATVQFRKVPSEARINEKRTGEYLGTCEQRGEERHLVNIGVIGCVFAVPEDALVYPDF